MKARKTFPNPVSEQAVEFVPIGRPIVIRRSLERKYDCDRLFPQAYEYRPPRKIRKTCFIHRLPRPLLFKIFCHYLRDDVVDDHRTRGLIHRPEDRQDDASKHLRAIHAINKPALTSNLSSSATQLTLFAVCKYWRGFYNYPALWASLAVYKPRMAQIPLISFWLDQSASLQRRAVSIALYLYAPLDDEDYDLSAVEAILKIFLDPQNTRRTRHMTLKLAGELHSHCFPPIIDAPYLKSLELELGNCDLPWCLMYLIYQRDPMLRRFFWHPVQTERHSLGIKPWNRLTHIKVPIINLSDEPKQTLFRDLLTALIYCENLISLEIVMAAPSLSQPNMRFPSMISQQRRSQRFLNERGPYEMFSPVSQDATTIAIQYKVTLPRLLHLKFEASGIEADPFLLRIRTPNLRVFEIIHHKGLCIDSGLHVFLDRHILPLTQLTIYDPAMDEKTVVRLLTTSIPELLHLELCVAPVGNYVMRILTVEEKYGDYMPNLRKLVLPECTASNGHLVDMVMSRRPTLKELRLSLPTTTKKGSRRRIVSEEQYKELCHLRNMTKDLSKGEFSLIVD